MHGSDKTCMADVLCQLFCLLHAGHAVLMLQFACILNVCLVDGCLLDDTYSTKLPQPLYEDLTDVPVRFVGHSAARLHVYMMYNASDFAEQAPGLYCN